MNAQEFAGLFQAAYDQAEVLAEATNYRLRMQIQVVDDGFRITAAATAPDGENFVMRETRAFEEVFLGGPQVLLTAVQALAVRLKPCLGTEVAA